MMGKTRRFISHLLHPVQGEIWCLHRVVDNRSVYPGNRELEITPGYLKDLLLQYKNKGFDFVSVDELLGKRSPWPRKRVNISFDDGFRDIYTHAYPLFKKYHIPFTIYLTTGFPDGRADVWWIQLEQHRSVEEFERLMKRIYESGRPMATAMHEMTETEPDPALARSLSLSWTEIKEMVDSGLCTIGSHTVSHPGLTRIGIEACRYELEESKRIIDERIGCDVVHLSYPHSMEDDVVRRAVIDAGYVSATLGYGGSIRSGDDPYRLHRNYIVQE